MRFTIRDILYWTLLVAGVCLFIHLNRLHRYRPPLRFVDKDGKPGSSSMAINGAFRRPRQRSVSSLLWRHTARRGIMVG